MLSLFLFSLIPSCLAVLGDNNNPDKNCTVSDGGTGVLYTPMAVACRNVYDDGVCDSLFGPVAQKAKAGDATQARPDNCWKNPSAPATPIVVDDKQRTLAIGTCPKTCGYCCLTPEYSCANKPKPRINCATVTDDMCRSIQWRQTIAEDCPAACGFCLDGGCIDIAPNCNIDNSRVCSTIGMEQFVMDNCRRTCDLCPQGSFGSTTRRPGACTDFGTNCQSWKLNGFCTSMFYTLQQKQQYCGLTCGLC